MDSYFRRVEFNQRGVNYAVTRMPYKRSREKASFPS
jgi:hypothetical protein